MPKGVTKKPNQISWYPTLVGCKSPLHWRFFSFWCDSLSFLSSLHCRWRFLCHPSPLSSFSSFFFLLWHVLGWVGQVGLLNPILNKFGLHDCVYMAAYSLLDNLINGKIIIFLSYFCSGLIVILSDLDLSRTWLLDYLKMYGDRSINISLMSRWIAKIILCMPAHRRINSCNSTVGFT